MMTTPDTAPSLLDQVRAAMPDLRWDAPGYSAGVYAHGLPRRRWLSVEPPRDGTYHVTVWRSVRETPKDDGDVDRLTAGRCRRGPDLAALLGEAVADPLDPVNVAGLVLWPVGSPGVERYTDDGGRYTFSRAADDGWRWEANHPAAAKAAALFTGFSRDLGGHAATLPEAVADALDAPRRLAALVEVLAADLAQAAPAPDPWTYAGVLVARDGERAFVGPSPTLLDLKDQMRQAEGPFIGRMNTDASHLVAVPAAQAEGLDAAALIAHPAAVRLERY